jgi:predicted nucleic acid-binding Zn ribbon protein
MTRDDPRPIGDALRSVRRELGLGEPSHFDALTAAWPELVGTALAAHARPRALRDGVLGIVVDGPEWASQLRFLDQVLVERIAADLPQVEVREVRVTVARDPGRRP